MTLACNSNGINGFVLAGGLSTRMGKDKGALDWHGHTLLEHMTHLLSTVTDRVRVVGRAPLLDRMPGLGPLGGIATALETSETDANLVVAVDLPLLTPEFLKYFRGRFENSNRSVLACNIDGRFPLILGLRKSVDPVLTEWLQRNDGSVRGFLGVCQLEIITEGEVGAGGFNVAMFRNLNTHRDYVEALQLAQISDFGI